MDLILDTIKKTVGVSLEDDGFNVDLLLYINSAIGILSQIGLFEADKPPIITTTTTWSEILFNKPELEMVKSYVTFKVKSMFDPPTSSAASEAVNRILKELEWRIQNANLINNISKEAIN